MMIEATSQLLRDIGRHEVLPQEQVRELIAIAQSDSPKAIWAKQKVATHNLKLVVSIAKDYSRYCKSFELAELVSIGAIGLQRAIEKFNLKRNVKFSTYATLWIRQAISREFYKSDRLIRLPVHVYENHSLICKTAKELRSRLGRNPTLEDIAAELETVVDWVEKYIKLPRRAMSLDFRLTNDKGEDGVETIDFVAAYEPPPIDYAANCELSDRVTLVLNTLGDRERQILEMRYGIDDGVPKSLREVANNFDVTHQRIAQIEKKVMAEIKPLLTRLFPKEAL